MQIRKLAAIVAALMLAGAAGAEQLVTVRVGEQDTCDITGVTTVAKDAVRFDLSKLAGGAKVRRALLRLWVSLDRRSPIGRHFLIDRCGEEGFDGLKVWEPKRGPAEPLDTVWPFLSSIACHEWDVTSAVAAHAGKDAVTLKTNFPLPGNGFQPAWQRPYLQITREGPNPNAPAQPTDLKARFRAGQVFLTWKQVPHPGAFFDSTFRLYRHDKPITAENLHQAELLGEVNRNSQLNYRRTAYSYGGLGSYGTFRHFWSYVQFQTTRHMSKLDRIRAHNARLPKRYNFVIDDAWRAGKPAAGVLADFKAAGPGARMLEGPALADQTGLFVHTCRKAGPAFFAVTSVVEGNENRRIFSRGNALPRPVQMKVAPPRPVLQVVFNHAQAKHGQIRGGYQLRQYAYWGGGDGLHLEPSTPFVFQVHVPLPFVGGPKAGAPVIGLGSIYWPSPLVAYDRPYIPPTRLAPFPSLHCSLNDTGWPHARQFYPVSRSPAEAEGRAHFAFPPNLGVRNAPASNFGYHDRLNTGRDPRKATVRPYFENRIVRALEMFFGEFPQADRNRVLLRGEGSAFLLGIHRPEVFASVSSSQFAPWSAPWNDSQWRLVGMRRWGLKTDRGHSVWDWNDPIWYSRKFPRLVWPFLSNCQSPNYARADDLTHWRNMGFPRFYLDLQAEKRGGRWWWCDIGDAPDGKGALVPLNQPYPAFTRVNFAETPRPQWRKEPRGSLNGYLDWGPNARHLHALRRKAAEHDKLLAAMGTVDAPGRFEMAIRIGDHGLRQNGQDVPPTNANFGTADVTPWRLQQFKVAPGRQYLWINRRIATGQVLQAGTVQPDRRGLLTVPGFLVDRDPVGNKLVLAPSTGSGQAVPAIDRDRAVAVSPSRRGRAVKEIKLPYADYVQACLHPVLCPAVKLPATTFKISEFTLGGNCNPDGSRTFSSKGGFGMGGVKTTVMIPQAGDYVLALRAKAARGVLGNWPAAVMKVGGHYGRVFAPRIIDTTDWDTYRWYARLDPGKLDIDIVTPSDYYLFAQLPELARGRQLAFADLTITRLEPQRAAKQAAEIRLSPRGLAVPAGLPTRMTAAVLNGLGKPTDAAVSWACRGADITAGGVLTPPATGACVVTASAGGVRASATVRVAAEMVEVFNEGCGALRDGWSPVELAQAAGRWFTPDRGHHMLNSLWFRPAARAAKPGEVKSALLWAHGTGWRDYEVSADVVLAPQARTPRDGTRGLIVRAADKDNGCRLEVRRQGGGAVVRLIRRTRGAEKVVAESRTAPPLAPFDYQTNPLCRGWNGWDEVQAKALADWRLDRLRVQVAGDVVRAWVNGKEVFPGGVKGAAAPSGTFGLYAETPTCFDNVKAKAVK